MTGALPGLDDLQVVAVGEWREEGVGFGLVPEGGGGDVVLEGEVAVSGAPAERLDGDAQVLLESDGVRNVPAVHAESLVCLVDSGFAGRDHLGQTGVESGEDA